MMPAKDPRIMTIDQYRELVWLQITEEQFRVEIRNLARDFGWPICYHVYRSQRSDPGFPDLVIARSDPQPRIIFAELKRQKGVASAAQKFVLGILSKIPFLEVYYWKPSDWDEIIRILQP